MPIISVFFGIIVRMYYKEREPAHFHAEHQGQQGKFDFAGEMRPAIFSLGRRCD
jgi:hypothetical protein